MKSVFIQRSLATFVKQPSHKATVLLGARRVGKTTLLNSEVASVNRLVEFNGDDLAESAELAQMTREEIRTMLSDSEAILIDEAQKIPGIGLFLKRLVDCNERLTQPRQILVTGSSSLDLRGGMAESAVGRFRSKILWPLSVGELADEIGWVKTEQQLARLMVYGLFPAVYLGPDEARQTLHDYCDGILFKDIFAIGGVRHPSRFTHLVKLLAYQIGSEANFDNLARETGLSRDTVIKYVDLLEQCFLIKVCPSFSRNIPNELKKAKKIYFCDLGIRNALIKDFSTFSSRADKGALWENFFYMERLKLHEYASDFTEIFFWRTASPDNKEVDFVEVCDQTMQAFECKASESTRVKWPKRFVQSYPNARLSAAFPCHIRQYFEKNPRAIVHSGTS